MRDIRPIPSLVGVDNLMQYRRRAELLRSPSCAEGEHAGRRLTLVGAAAAAVVAGLLAALAPPASAGTFTVTACGKNPNGGTNNSFVGRSSSGFQAIGDCPGGALRVRSVGVPTANGQDATFTFAAPTGTSLRSIAYDVTGGRSYKTGYAVELASDTGLLEGCAQSVSNACGFDTGFGASKNNVALGGARQVFTRIRCTFGAGCPGNEGIGSVDLTGVAVEIEDLSVPSIGTAKSGSVENNATQSGDSALTFSSADNVGIKAARLLVEGTEKARHDYTCDYSRRVPCADVSADTLVFDSRTVPNGTRLARLIITDAAGNESSYDKTIQVQNAATAAPQGPTAGATSSGGATSISSESSETSMNSVHSTTTQTASPALANGSTITLRASKRAVKNRQSVAFSGAVIASARPFSSVIVAMQAKVGNRWVTFKQTRSAADGTFQAKYRFRRTFRTQTYTFRAHVAQQQGYDATRDSAAVRVKVRR